MNTKIISEKSLDIIDQYKNFKIGNAICPIPYFNNKRIGLRGGIRVEIGKGSPKDIFDEIKDLAFKQKIDLNSFNSESLKKSLVDNNIGIDCSGFAYYILNEESLSKGKGSLDKHLSFILCKGIIGKIKCKIRPVENTDVATFANDKNSKTISLKEVQVGDIITMTGGSDSVLENKNNIENNLKERDHILIIHQIEYQNFLPIIIYYIHAIAWPSDGEYGHGIHEGKIEILDLNKNIIEQKWIENGKVSNENTESENYTFTRAMKSKTEIRRLEWF